MFILITDCPLDIISTLPSISEDSPITCHLSELCTGVRCCVDALGIGKSFTVFVEVDACDLVLKVGIGRLTFTKTLFDDKLIEEEPFYLFGVVRIE